MRGQQAGRRKARCAGCPRERLERPRAIPFFAQTEAARGIFPAGGATINFVREAGWGNAMGYMLRGDEWAADAACRLGLVQCVTAPGQQLDRAIEIARKTAAAAPLGIRATPGSAHRALIDDQEAAFAALFTEWRRLAQSEDRQEYLQALQEKPSSTLRADPCHRTFLRIAHGMVWSPQLRSKSRSKTPVKLWQPGFQRAGGIR